MNQRRQIHSCMAAWNSLLCLACRDGWRGGVLSVRQHDVSKTYSMNRVYFQDKKTARPFSKYHRPVLAFRNGLSPNGAKPLFGGI